LPEATILLPHALAVKDNWLFLASSNGLWKYDLSHLLAVEDNQALVNTYKLSQNYPNPFNPATTISYSIPKASFVKLKVYDMLGRVVQTLVNKEQSAGSYKVRFEASSLPSGMYIYEIRSDNFIKSGKMLLLK
ncbi:MAG: T9SS type A sorting domain-containing protein, partial [Ignavibacteriales bacterium]